MKLLILIIGLSLSSNCAGQRRIVKKTIRSSKTRIIVIPKIEPKQRPNSILNKQQEFNKDLWKNLFLATKPYNVYPQPIKDTMPSMPKSPFKYPFNNIKPDSTAISSDFMILLRDPPPQEPKFKYTPIKLIDLTYNLPDVISYNYSSGIFHLIATKNPLYHDYKGFTFTKTISYFSFNNKNFND